MSHRAFSGGMHHGLTRIRLRHKLICAHLLILHRAFLFMPKLIVKYVNIVISRRILRLIQIYVHLTYKLDVSYIYNGIRSLEHMHALNYIQLYAIH